MSAFDGYVQAKFHGGKMAGGPTFIVIHDAETPLRSGYADSIADFFRRGPAAGTSAHAMVGPEKALKLLPDDVVAYAAGPKANPKGWHLEQTGYARFRRADWTTSDGMTQLNRVGACAREVADTWGIPKRWVTDDQLRRAAAGDRSSGGITTHQQVARVLKGTTHTDPEENYPRDLLLQIVLGTPAAAPADAAPAPKEYVEMKVIQSEKRGIALVGAGYYRQLVDAEDVVSATMLWGAPYVDNERRFDVWVAQATQGTASATSGQLNALAAQVAGIKPADVDEVALANLLAPKLTGATADQIAEALREVLRTGVGG